jgi:hypothetical protein
MMTALLLVLVVVAVGAAFLGRPIYRFCTAYSRLSSLCVRSEGHLGLYDSHRQAEAKVKGRLPFSQAQKGSLWPSLRLRAGLPVRYHAYARVGLDWSILDFILEQFAHHTGRSWTASRKDQSRWVIIEQAPPPLAALPMPRVEVAAIGWWDQFPIGTSQHGPVWWNPGDDETANLLVVARTGWGKGHLVGNLLDHADAGGARWKVYVLDPEDDIEVAGHRSIGGVGLDPAAQLKILRAVDAEFAERTRLHEHGMTWAQIIARRGRVLVIYDEFPSIMAPPARSALDYEPRRQAQALIGTLLSRGRKRGIHGVALAWDPRAKALGGEIRSAFGARLAGWLDPAEYPLALRRGVPRLLTGHGHGWWCAKEADPVEIQTYDRTYHAQQHARPGPAAEAPTWTATRIFGAIGSPDRR